MEEKIKKFINELHIVQKEAKKLAFMKLKDSHISPEQCHLLVLINCCHMNQKQLAAQMHISEATLSVRITRLEKAGYVEKEINLNDKRNYTLKISDKGKEILEEQMIALEGIMEDIFKGVSDEEINNAIVLLKKLENNMNRGEEDC